MTNFGIYYLTNRHTIDVTNKFFKGAAMLAALGIIGKLIGMMYRLPLTNILGAEGMGLYQMIFPVYSLILALICGGLPSAISKTVSESVALDRAEEAKQALLCSLTAVVIVGTLISVATLALKDVIAQLQGNPKASVAYVAIAPAIMLSGMIACFRGYFQGKQNLLPSGISQIVEQTIKAMAGLFFAAIFLKRGVEYGVFGAALGVSISEAFALVYLALRYVVSTKKGERASSSVFMPDLQSQNAFMTEAAADVAVLPKGKGNVAMIGRIFSIAVPITLGALVLPISQVADSFLIVNLLVKGGTSVELATSQFGLISGPVGSLLNMPSVITAAIATSLLPAVAERKSKGQKTDTLADEKNGVFLAVILPCVIVLSFAPEPLLRILYSKGLSDAEIDTAALILRVESIDILTLGMIQLDSALLQGVGKVGLPVINLMFGAVIKVAANIVLLPLIGIIGAAIGNVLFYAVTCTLDSICAKKYCGAFINRRKALKILLCSLAFAGIFMLYPLAASFMPRVWALIVVALTAGAVYLLLIFKTKCILLREILS